MLDSPEVEGYGSCSKQLYQIYETPGIFSPCQFSSLKALRNHKRGKEMAKFKISYPPCNQVLIPWLSLGFQKEKDDPVTAVQQITELNCNIGKLKLLIDSSLDGKNFTKLMKETQES